MKIKFLGATNCITGSCHLLQINEKQILLDCGLFQGHDTKLYENDKFYFSPEEIDLVILSHCHLDHCGRIPLLYKKGYKGRVICTKPTVDLCEYLLRDTVKIFKEEANKDMDQEPLFDEKDVEKAINSFCGYGYDEEIILDKDIKLTLRDAGHVLGSAICEIIIKEKDSKPRKLLYSGDLGNINKDILKDPSYGMEADYLIIECTYGSKFHKMEDNYFKLLKIIKKTMAAGGNLIIPCFSLGRTQEIIYMLNKYVEAGTLSNCQVYVDSPLASALTEIFRKYEDYFDRESKILLAKGDDPLEFKGLHFVDKEKIDFNNVKEGAVIITAGGAGLGGRAAKQIRNNIERRECGIIITAYKGNKSIGSKLLRGIKEIEILGEIMQVKASIYYLGGLSLHADKRGLLNWVGKLKKTPERIFLVHGEGKNILSFNKALKERNYKSEIAEFLQEIEIKDS